MSGRTHPMAAARPAFRGVKSFVSHEQFRLLAVPGVREETMGLRDQRGGTFCYVPRPEALA